MTTAIPVKLTDEEQPAAAESVSPHDRHFATDHLLADLKGRSVRGGAVTLTAQALKFILQMGSTMVLARLLTPQDFGLIAMVTAVTGFVAMFKDAGLSMATIQRAEITHAQVSTLFWINVALSVLVMLVVAALAPAIAWFYGEPQLTWITLALAGTFIFSGLTVQHQALLRRQMRFRELATIDIVSMIVGIATAIIMAAMNCGYWSLVGLTVGTTLANCALVWMYSSWRPGPSVRGSGVGAMVRFGGGLTGFNVLNYFTRNADNVIIGFALGSGSLGIYSKAYNLLMMPIRQFNGPISAVMLPSLSRLQNDPTRYRRAYLRAITMLAFVGMPLVAFLFVIADDAVLIILGPGWEGAAVVFRWLAPAALFGTINVAPGWLCTTLGRARVQVVWAAISAPITVAAFIIGAQWGIVGVAAAFSISWCLLLLLFIAMACHRSPVSMLDLMLSIAPVFLAAVGSVAICFWFASVIALHESPFTARLLVNGLVFTAMYLVLTLLFPSGRARIHAFWTDGFASFSLRSKGAVA